MKWIGILCFLVTAPLNAQVKEKSLKPPPISDKRQSPSSPAAKSPSAKLPTAVKVPDTAPKEVTPPAEPPALEKAPTAGPQDTLIINPPTPAEPTLSPANPSAPSTADTSSTAKPHLFGLHAALGFPHPYTFGLNYVHPSKMFSGELNYGYFGGSPGGFSLKYTNLEGGLRWHPFEGSFFLGGLLGTRTLAVEKKAIISAFETTAKFELTTTYISPILGWMWGQGSSGFFAGMDFGVLLPSNASASLTTNADTVVQQTSDYQTLDAEVRDKGKKLGEIALPFWTLIKIGYLF